MSCIFRLSELLLGILCDVSWLDQWGTARWHPATVAVCWVQFPQSWFCYLQFVVKLILLYIGQKLMAIVLQAFQAVVHQGIFLAWSDWNRHCQSRISMVRMTTDAVQHRNECLNDCWLDCRWRCIHSSEMMLFWVGARQMAFMWQHILLLGRPTVLIFWSERWPRHFSTTMSSLRSPRNWGRPPGRCNSELGSTNSDLNA